MTEAAGGTEATDAGGSCPVCGDTLDLGAEHRCSRCETPHHAECWDYNEGCAVFGCQVTLPAVVEEAASDLVVLDDGDAPGAVEIHDVYRQLGLVPPAAWRILAGGLFFITIGLISSLSAMPGFFGLLSVVILAIPVTAVILLLIADALPGIFTALANERAPAQLEETPLKRLEARLSEDPKNVHLLEMVAFGRYAEQRWEDALEVYEQVLDLRPLELRAGYQRAKCLERLARYGEAERAFTALAGNPNNEDLREKARFWLGVIEKKKRRGVAQ